MARAYLAIARGSPCVVLSVEAISPSPVINNPIGTPKVFLRMVAKDGAHVGGFKLKLFYEDFGRVETFRLSTFDDTQLKQLILVFGGIQLSL